MAKPIASSMGNASLHRSPWLSPHYPTNNNYRVTFMLCTIWLSLGKRITTRIIPVALLLGLISCGGGGSRSADQTEAAAQPIPAPAQNSAPAQSAAAARFTATLDSVPAPDATVSGIVTLNIKGSNIGNVELLPAQGYTPKLATFTVSPDKTSATGKLDTTKLADGPLVARISAFDTPAGSATATEIHVMPARTWIVKNDARPQPEAFRAQLAAAPPDGATVSRIITLEVTGSNLVNVELLPAEGFVPKHAVFQVAANGTTASATVDTATLPNGPMSVRISAFDAPAGAPGNEIAAMFPRTWNIQNRQGDSSFSAAITEGPADGATLSGPVRLVVTGNNLQNVELLPPSGYSPKYASFTISGDRRTAIAILDTAKLTNGSLPVRISAFDAPAGSARASEIVAMPMRTWTIQNRSTWTLTDLGALNGESSAVSGINDAGEVVGRNIMDRSGNTHAFLYKSGSMIDLGTLGGSSSDAVAINNAGHIVGSSTTASDATHPYLYHDGTMTDLGTQPALASYANGDMRVHGINDAGTIVGRATMPGGYAPFTIFLYRDGVVTSLNSKLGDRTFLYPVDINNAEQIVFSFYYGLGTCGAFLYTGEALLELAMRTADNRTYDCNSTSGINDLGQVVGSSFDKFRLVRDIAYLHSDGVGRDIGALPYSTATAGSALNDRGQVVGHAATSAGARAYLFSEGTLLDLTNLPEVKAAGWTLTHAIGINNPGQIAGVGTNAEGSKHAYLLTPPKR